MNDVVSHLIAQLGEEGCEVSQVTSKVHRFGLHDIYTHIDEQLKRTRLEDKGTNKFRLIGEMNDMEAIMDMLVFLNVIPPDWEKESIKAKKHIKVMRYLRYAVEVGTLIPDDNLYKLFDQYPDGGPKCSICHGAVLLKADVESGKHLWAGCSRNYEFQSTM